jgi:transposase
MDYIKVNMGGINRAAIDTLDLSFVRELVTDTYALIGRPSIDPIVFFKLQLVMFFERIHLERELMRAVADRLSIRWYLGYNFDEDLPDHSSLTKIRNRYGLAGRCCPYGPH